MPKFFHNLHVSEAIDKEGLCQCEMEWEPSPKEVKYGPRATCFGCAANCYLRQDRKPGYR
jgi:hypothetical protein